MFLDIPHQHHPENTLGYDIEEGVHADGGVRVNGARPVDKDPEDGVHSPATQQQERQLLPRARGGCVVVDVDMVQRKKSVLLAPPPAFSFSFSLVSEAFERATSADCWQGGQRGGGRRASRDLLKQAPRGPCPRLRLLQHGPVHQEIQAPERLQGAAAFSEMASAYMECNGWLDRSVWVAQHTV